MRFYIKVAVILFMATRVYPSWPMAIMSSRFVQRKVPYQGKTATSPP
ncbi:Uncharacterised protein [Klebsiella michiganensis]|nr:Uncharacterised protein [Klebsiella michiganensis]